MATDTRQPGDENHRRFARFRPPQAGEGGTMSLLDHIRELRYRIIVSFIAVVITSSVAFVFYRPLVEIVMYPYQQASFAIKAKNPTASLQVVNTGVAAPFVLNMRVAIVAGLIAACLSGSIRSGPLLFRVCLSTRRSGLCDSSGRLSPCF